jgi:hydrogenase maturation protease
MKPERTLILAYGNPGRGDDALGPVFADRAREWESSEVEIQAAFQLNIEDAATLAEFGRVLFVDASETAGEPFSWERAYPAPAVSFTSHSMAPETVLAISEDHFSARPEAWTLAIRGYNFELCEGLSDQARHNLDEAVRHVQSLMDTWRETKDGKRFHKETHSLDD